MSARATPQSFWARVKKSTPDKCWEWQGACNNTGYGTLSYQQQAVVAHRVAAYLTGMVDTLAAPHDRTKSGFVLHSCDNAKCCNPAHFSIGTYATNQLDAYKRNRRKQPNGSAHANSKLSDAEVLDIRRIYSDGQLTQTEIAGIYGISQIAVSLITRRKSYTGI